MFLYISYRPLMRTSHCTGLTFIILNKCKTFNVWKYSWINVSPVQCWKCTALKWEMICFFVESWEDQYHIRMFNGCMDNVSPLSFTVQKWSRNILAWVMHSRTGDVRECITFSRPGSFWVIGRCRYWWLSHQTARLAATQSPKSMLVKYQITY